MSSANARMTRPKSRAVAAVRQGEAKWPPSHRERSCHEGHATRKPDRHSEETDVVLAAGYDQEIPHGIVGDHEAERCREEG